MSDVRIKPRAFFDLFIDGQAGADDAGDFIDAWHSSGDEEQRPLTEFLGLTEDEFDVWMMDRRILPDIAAARRPGGPTLTAVMTERFRQMRAAKNPIDQAAQFSLGHWLRARGIDPG